jgi:hypothetical protein
MAKWMSRLTKPGLLGIAALILLACGATTSGLVTGGGTSVATVATATATSTQAPTATPRPTATPKPGHMLVTVHPSPYGSTSTSSYVCHSGTTCHEGGVCTSSSWPTFTISNSGQASLTWHGTVNGNGASTVGWTLAPTHGTLGGGGSTTVTINDDPSQIQTTSPSVVFTGAAQTVTIALSCGIG